MSAIESLAIPTGTPTTADYYIRMDVGPGIVPAPAPPYLPQPEPPDVPPTDAEGVLYLLARGDKAGAEFTQEEIDAAVLFRIESTLGGFDVYYHDSLVYSGDTLPTYFRLTLQVYGGYAALALNDAVIVTQEVTPLLPGVVAIGLEGDLAINQVMAADGLDPWLTGVDSNVIPSASDGLCQNGISWRQVDLLRNTLLPAPTLGAAGNGIFLLGAPTSNGLHRSEGGGSWGITSLPGVYKPSTMSFASGAFYVTNHYSRAIMRSTNGVSWTTQTPPNIHECWGPVAGGNNRLVVAPGRSNGGPSVILAYSTDDGASWMPVTLPTSNTFYNGAPWAVAFISGRFVLVPPEAPDAHFYRPYVYYTSPNGVSWTERTLTPIPTGSALFDWGVPFPTFTTGRGKLVLRNRFQTGHSYSSQRACLTTEDGLTWYLEDSGSFSAIKYDMTYGPGGYTLRTERGIEQGTGLGVRTTYPFPAPANTPYYVLQTRGSFVLYGPPMTYTVFAGTCAVAAQDTPPPVAPPPPPLPPAPPPPPPGPVPPPPAPAPAPHPPAPPVPTPRADPVLTFTPGQALAMTRGVYAELLFGVVSSDRQVTVTRVLSDPLFMQVLAQVPLGMTVLLDWPASSLQGRVYYRGIPLLAGAGSQALRFASTEPPYSGDELLVAARDWVVTLTPSTAWPPTSIRMSAAFPDTFIMQQNVAYNATVLEIRSTGPADLVGFYVRPTVGSYALATGDTPPTGVDAALDWDSSTSYGRVRFTGRPLAGTAGSVKHSTYTVFYTDGVNPDTVLATITIPWQVVP